MREDHYDLIDSRYKDDIISKHKKEILHPKSESGAAREALHIPYFRQVPLEAIAAGATSLEYGAKKYCERNWENGLPWQQMIDSLRRHLDDFERGIEYDDGPNGSGLHQTCMIMASSMMLCASVIRKIGEDNRLPPIKSNAMTAKECAKWMAEQLERSEEFNTDRNK